MLPGFGGKSRLGYHTHYVVDGGKSRIILAALVTPALVMDNTPMLDLARWTRFRWQIHPRIAVGDTRYGSEYNISGLEQDGIKTYIPPHIQGSHQRHKRYHQSLFTYSAKEDHYICPQGEILPYKFTSIKFIEPKRKFVMLALLPKNVELANMDEESDVLFIRNILRELKLINPQRLTKKQCVRGRCG